MPYLQKKGSVNSKTKQWDSPNQSSKKKTNEKKKIKIAERTYLWDNITQTNTDDHLHYRSPRRRSERERDKELI